MAYLVQITIKYFTELCNNKVIENMAEYFLEFLLKANINIL